MVDITSPNAGLERDAWNGMLVSTFRTTTGLVEEDSPVSLKEALQGLV